MFARITRSATALRHALLDFLFPPRCVVCRRLGEWYCAACRTRIERILPPICQHCGRPLHATHCFACEKTPLAMDGTRAIAFFEGGLRTAIHALKYQQRIELAHPLAALMHEYLTTHPIPVDALIAVPLHAKRERERGYNQSHLLAQALGAKLNVPVWHDALTRVRATASQVEQPNTAARRNNVHDAFTATARVAEARILLIDDVCTTGATMEACSAALYTHHAKSVWGLAIARSH